MQNWIKVSVILSLFGFLKEIRPSEPFVFEYLSGKWTNITAHEVNYDIFTVGTYFNTPSVVVAFLVTDLLKYKPLIVVCGICGMIIWSMLIWTPTLFLMQIMEIFYGVFISCDVAYFTYMYAAVDKEHYPKVTSNTRMAYLLGRTVQGITGQLLTSYGLMDYKQLNYITLTAMVLATITSVLLPSVKHTTYFHRHGREYEELTIKKNMSEAFSLMGTFLRDSYSNDLVIKWCLVNATAACGFGLVETYIQTLWAEIHKTDQQNLQNGYVISVYTFIGVIGSFFAGYFKINWSKRSTIVITLYFLLSAVLLIIASQTYSLYTCYAIYALFGGSFNFMFTVAYTEISQRILSDSYGLIFGINTFVGLVMQSLITTIVLNILETPVREEYLIFGLWHIAVLILYLIWELFLKLCYRRQKPITVNA